jgi:Zn-finger nucleic acid-binding protein
VELARPDERERWSCSKCRGVLFGLGEVVARLVAIAPDLVPEGGIGDVSTIGRRSVDHVLCAVCGAEMEPVFLGGVDVDRCYRDQMLWFDFGELELVMEQAREQRDDRASWLARLLR